MTKRAQDDRAASTSRFCRQDDRGVAGAHRGRMTTAVQSNARTTMAMVVQKLRTSGWDPYLTGVPDTDTDSDSSDDIDYIEIYCDFDGDGATDKPDEQVMIRHDSSQNQVEWQTEAGAGFSVLAINISNDEDGDGTAEKMFTPMPTVNPTTIRVKLTSQSPVKDPVTGDFLRYTLSSDVLIRKSI